MINLFGRWSLFFIAVAAVAYLGLFFLSNKIITEANLLKEMGLVVSESKPETRLTKTLEEREGSGESVPLSKSQESIQALDTVKKYELAESNMQNTKAADKPLVLDVEVKGILLFSDADQSKAILVVDKGGDMLYSMGDLIQGSHVMVKKIRAEGVWLDDNGHTTFIPYRNSLASDTTEADYSESDNRLGGVEEDGSDSVSDHPDDIFEEEAMNQEELLLSQDDEKTEPYQWIKDEESKVADDQEQEVFLEEGVN